MVQLAHLALILLHGNDYAPPLKVHPLTYVNLWLLLPDEFAPAMSTPVACQLLLPAILLLWTNAQE